MMSRERRDSRAAEWPLRASRFVVLSYAFLPTRIDPFLADACSSTVQRIAPDAAAPCPRDGHGALSPDPARAWGHRAAVAGAACAARSRRDVRDRARRRVLDSRAEHDEDFA